MPYKDVDQRREAYKRWYHKSRDNRKKVIAKGREQKRRMWQWYRSLKTGKQCSRCDESHPAAISFHHRDGREKEMEIPVMVKRGWGKERVLAEIAKCDVLCLNCHSKLHWDEKHANS